MIGNTFFHVSRGLSERKKLHFFLSKFFFGLWDQNFPDLWRTFDRQGLQNSVFFCQRNFVTRKNFFQVNEITIRKFLTSDRELFGFLAKKVSRLLEFNYSCSDELSEKNHLFHKLSYLHESFRTLGDKCSKRCPIFFGRAVEKKQPMSPEVLYDEKQNVSNVSEKGVF